MVSDLECDHQLSRIVRLAPPPADPPHRAHRRRSCDRDPASAGQRLGGSVASHGACGQYTIRVDHIRPGRLRVNRATYARLGRRRAEMSARRAAELYKCVIPNRRLVALQEA